MKKIAGWFLIVFCSVIIFILGITILCLLFDFPEHSAISEKLTTSIGGGIFIIFSIIGFRYGLKQIKKENKIETIDYPDILDISFKGKIEFKSYRDLMIGLTFKNKIFIYLFFIIFSSIIPLMAEDIELSQMNYFYALFMVSLGVFIPVSIFYQIKKQYNTNAIFKESLTYHLTNTSIQLISNTLNSTQHWTNFVKIKETKSFFLFYQGSLVATLLEKKMFSEHELNEFNIFIKSLAIPRE